MIPALAALAAALMAVPQAGAPPRERLVVATFDEQGVPAGMGDVVSDMVIRAIDAPEYELLERRQVRRVLEEQAFATSDLTQPGEAVRYGRLADTRFVLVGTVYRLDGVYLVSARMVDSETGIVRESARAVVQFRTVDEMAAKVGELARLLGLRVGPPLAPEPPSAPASPAVPLAAAPPASAPVADRRDASTVRDLLERVGDAGTSPVPVSVATPGRTIMSGSPVPLRIRSDREGFLSLFVVDAEGNVRMLLPNARTERFRVRAGQSVSIPGDLPFTLRAAPPAGVTRIRAVVTDGPIAVSGSVEAGELLRKVSLADAVAADGSPGAWVAGELEFIVVDAGAAPRLPAVAPAAPAAPPPPAGAPSAVRAFECVSAAFDATIGAERPLDESSRRLFRWPLSSPFEPRFDIAWAGTPGTASAVPTIGVIDADFDPDDVTLARSFSGLAEESVRRLREEIRRNGRPSFRHGNRVASLIGGEAPWIPSVLPGVRIVPIRITSVVDAPAYRAERGGAAELVESLRAALAAGCKVVNVSLHVPITGSALDAFVRDAVWDDLERAGVVVVCAAGNGREDLDASPRFPACIDRPNILCVGAVGPDGRLAEWGDGGSARGARSVDLMAPGSALVVSDGGGRAVIACGTSYACAIATGAVGRLMADEPGLDPGELIERLVADSRSLPVSSAGLPACRGGILRWPQPH
jgi:subtilisin family serine protease